MLCKYFGKCGSCLLYDKKYDEQIEYKTSKIKEIFDVSLPLQIHSSDDIHFRSKAEFKIFHKNNTISYAMSDIDKKILCIDECLIVNEHIHELMDKLLLLLSKDEVLSYRLFSIEFLSSFYTGEMLVSLIYHKKLDEVWESKASKLQKVFDISIIGRSKKQKIICNKDFITQKINVVNKSYFLNVYEGAFSQANKKINEKMINFVLENTNKSDEDLLELYCGNGNFTIPLSFKFRKVLATEISKNSIKCAKENMAQNNVENISFARLSSLESTQALDKVRSFTRLKDINLDSYNFSTIFLDPPRAGLDEDTRKLASRFDNIIYISCNIDTLHRDYEQLKNTHTLKKWAFFDQFAYSKHMEMGMIFSKN